MLLASRQLPRRILTLWGGKVLMGATIVAAVIGLSRFGSRVSRQADSLEPDDAPGAGVIVRYEVARLWLPQTLCELAKRQSQSVLIRTHEDLRRFLELQAEIDVWYALTTRGHQVDGDFTDVTIFRQPYDDPSHFPELLYILSAAAGKPPLDPNADWSTALIDVLPEPYLKRDPREAIAELASGL